MRLTHPQVVTGKFLVVPRGAIPQRHQVVADGLAARVPLFALHANHREFLGVPVDAPFEPAVERLFHVLGAQAGRVFDVLHEHGGIFLAVEEIDIDPPVGAVNVGLVAGARLVLAGGPDPEGDRTVIMKGI
jgi:hypothetical protein